MIDSVTVVELTCHRDGIASWYSGLVSLRLKHPRDAATIGRFGGVAQLGERRVRNAEVVSSILILSTKQKWPSFDGSFFWWI
jgi:hypothetical protein